ncbi:MAG: CHAT domain-containing protein [bacterium]|nr:CHAT domain-containing protein [bacterium]
MTVTANVEIEHLEESTYKVSWHESGKSFQAQAPELDRGKTLHIGHSLFHFLDGDAKHFSKALSDAETQGKTLELRIATCPKSSDWPLELVAKDHEFLLRNKVHLLRTIKHNETTARARTEARENPPNRPLKLLFMVGSPMDVKPLLEYEKEEQAIFKVTEKMAVDLEVEDSGTLEGLQERLMHREYDVVHLSGHADIKGKTPYFILETETGKRRDVTCDLLWKEALMENPPQLLFLSGCKTGQPGLAGQATETGETGVGSFARLMVSAFKVPAVLGWGRSVHDDQASVAAEFIYRDLCLGRSLTAAVQRARMELMDRFSNRGGNQAWHLLRLFCSSNPPDALVAKGQKATQLKPRKLKHTYLIRSTGRNIPIQKWWPGILKR